MSCSQAVLVPGDSTDLPMIYENMQKQFPPQELYPLEQMKGFLYGKNYRLLLYRRTSDNMLVAYALVGVMKNSNLLWLDYIAVLDNFKGEGYGSALFRDLMTSFCGPLDGMMFSVEHVVRDNDSLAQQQQRRLEFYHRLGAKQLKAGFLLPDDDGDFPMYLYFMPRPGVTFVSREVQLTAIRELFDSYYFYLEHLPQILPKFKHTIQDEALAD